MYMSAELWAEMLESEKVKVKKLEERYAQMMKDHHVSLCAEASSMPLSSGSACAQLAKSEIQICGTLVLVKYLVFHSQVSGKIKAIFGNKPGETIIAEAKENDASLIVMGTRGLGNIRRTILGSVSDFVLHHAHCPVTICRH